MTTHQSQEELREIRFNGKVYKTDGKSLWIDGVLQDIEISDEVKSIKEVKVLEVDGRLYHNNEWFSPISLTTEKIRGEERERIENVFKKIVPPHGLSLEDSVWLKRLLNKAFEHDN